MADEKVEVQFIISASGTATEDDALGAFEALVGDLESLSGSIVISGVSHPAEEFREEEEAEPEPAPRPTTQPAAKATTSSKG